MKRWARAAGVAIAGLFWLVTTLPAQDPGASDPNKRSQPAATQPAKDPYAVSLGTGELINLNGEPQSPAVGNGADSQNSEYADGLPLRPKSRTVAGQLFYGLSAASVYSDDPA